MANTELEKHRPNNEEELPVVLLHGTSGQSEDWSQVVERLTRHRPVIRLNYAEPVAGTDLANAPGVSDFADRVAAAAGLVEGSALTLLAFPLEQRLPHSLRRSMRRWFVRCFLYQVSVTAVTRE
jgi:pimeloyl-ACP methyl ester carboxylesterase